MPSGYDHVKKYRKKFRKVMVMLRPEEERRLQAFADGRFLQTAIRALIASLPDKAA